MPLMNGKSKKAFSKNVATEMEHGKPQGQALAIAYSVKRNAKKKAAGGSVQSGSKDMNMAEGGEISANNERRPMPDNRYNDSHEVSSNTGNKPARNDSWIGRPTVEQAQNNNGRMVKPIKHSKMVPQNGFSTRMRDEEDDLQDSASPGPYGKQPPEHDNEEMAMSSGHPVRDMEDEHSTHRRPYAKGGQIDEMNHPSKHDMEPKDSRSSLRLREDEKHLMDSLYTSEDEGDMYALDHNEEDPDRQGPAVSDMDDEHTTGRKPYAHGGNIQYRDAMDNEDDEMELNPAHDEYSLDDSEKQPEDEASMEHEDSKTASLMSRYNRGMQYSDSDEDELALMAEGGEILEESPDINSHSSMDTHEDDDQVDLSRNADEDANEEDQASWNALRKENYSESEGLKQLDSPRDSNLLSDDEELDSENQHDRVSRIMSKMNSRRQSKQR